MRDLNEKNITDATLETLRNTANPRTKQVLEAFVRHLHAFVREVEPTEEEWFAGINFLTRTGQLCTDTRQEYMLLSDVTGVTMLIDAMNHRNTREVTEFSVLGPFFAENRPVAENGSDISAGVPGDPMFFEGQVVTPDGKPVVGALVDSWHTDGEGHYDVNLPNLEGQPAMRAAFRTDRDGRFSYRSIMPSSYPIPGDGTVGELMQAASRPIIRPAHVHFMIKSPEYERMITALFVAGDDHLDGDPVFGVRGSLVQPFEKRSPGEEAPDGTRPQTPFYVVRHTFCVVPMDANSRADDFVPSMTTGGVPTSPNLAPKLN